eukprot:COSAG01_NODE_908_length_12794_cov_119.794171_12_plen_722_part_00
MTSAPAGGATAADDNALEPTAYAAIWKRYLRTGTPGAPKRDAIATVVHNNSLWAASPTEPVEDGMVWVHLLSMISYAVLIIAYTCHALVVWANFEAPILFESQETSQYPPVPLDFSIDCQDCRRSYARRMNGELWRLSWDYSMVPGGCAARDPSRFSDQLRQFCRAQNAPSPPGARRYFFQPYTNCLEGFDYLLPHVHNKTAAALGLIGFGPGKALTPWSVAADVPACQARCDANPACKGFMFNVLDNPTPVPPGFPPLVKNTCGMMTAATKCKTSETGNGLLHMYLLDESAPSAGTDISDPLDRCVITSRDAAMLKQSPSPDPKLASTASLPTKFLWGFNPNYVGPNSLFPTANVPLHPNPGLGESHAGIDSTGLGSLYETRFEIPLCFTGDDNTMGSKGISVEVTNIPDHAFHNPRRIGQAVTQFSSRNAPFRQQNIFQPWHKNTLHLGLKIERDDDEKLRTSEPYFKNFQYDGRVDWGRPEGLARGEMIEFRQKLAVAMGDKGDRFITDMEAAAVDAQIQAKRTSLAAASNVSYQQIVQWHRAQGDAFLKAFVSASAGLTAQYDDVSGGLTPLGRRRLSQNADAGQQTDDGNDGTFPNDIGRANQPSSQVAWKRLQMSVPDQFPPAVVGNDSDHDSTRRRLEGHDDWGGVRLAVQLDRFASVYTDGYHPTLYDVVAQIGGASGSLIGLLAMAIGIVEVMRACWRKIGGGQKYRVEAEP